MWPPINEQLMTDQTNHSDKLRTEAGNSLRNGDAAQAERAFRQLLEINPGELQALQFLAMRHLSRGEVDRAVQILAEAHRLHPEDPATLYQSGVARTAAGDLQGAVDDLQKTLALAPAMFVARLRLGMLLQQMGRSTDALIATFAAINHAQAQGHWLSDETTEPGLRDTVKAAMQFVNAGRRKLFDDYISPWRERYGRSELQRVDACLSIYLGERQADLPDARQRPKFLYFPGIPSQPYYPRSRFPAFDELEAGTASIREELSIALTQEQSLEPFLGRGSPQGGDTMLSATGDQPAVWDAYFFYRHGSRYDQHCNDCPQTTRLLDSAPLVRIREHAPEALFSVLRPGTNILPHRGVTNTRLVTHLPLIVPPDCALRVGGETHVWQPGQCVTFDDTFEHEAWNHSNETRVVLILDCWNPDLTEPERHALTDLVEGIGKFNEACELPNPST